MSLKFTEVFWHYDSQAGVDTSGLENLFSHSEALRFEKMKFVLRRNSFIAGRRAAKQLLLRCVPELRDFALWEISIENQENGAPYARVNGQRLPGTLSLSHSGQAAAAAYTPDPLIKFGIDLDLIAPRADSFLDTYLTQSELRWVRSTHEDERVIVGNLIWSAKEAVLKALQTGLRVDTREIEITTDGSPLVDSWYRFEVNKNNDRKNNWQGFWRKEGEMILTLVIGCNNQYETIHLDQIVY